MIVTDNQNKNYLFQLLNGWIYYICLLSKIVDLSSFLLDFNFMTTKFRNGLGNFKLRFPKNVLYKMYFYLNES